MTWDLTGAPELREALIDLLADALVAQVERLETAGISTGVTPGGNAREAEEARSGEGLRDAPQGQPRAARAEGRRPARRPGGRENAALRGAGASERALAGGVRKPAMGEREAGA